jgi:hypothetical protein
MTITEILTAINEVRLLTSQSPAMIEVDAKLLDLQERLLDDHGHEPQGVINPR